MNMELSGIGKIEPGRYDDISISGSCELSGLIRCSSFHSSGICKGGDVECSGTVEVTGISDFNSLRARNIIGSVTAEGDVAAEERIDCEGISKCKANVKCTELYVPGIMEVDGNIEAELITVDGFIVCGGLMNAEEIRIESYNRGRRVESRSGMCIGSIGGGRISIYSKNRPEKRKNLPLFEAMVSRKPGVAVWVREYIEGDSIALEGVAAPLVSGRVVAIGAGCEIDVLRYSEEVEISPDAVVRKVENVKEAVPQADIPTPPVPPEEVMQRQEELYDSEGHLRASVYARKEHKTVIDGWGYYPCAEMFYDTDNHVHGFICPEGMEGMWGFDRDHSIYWRLKDEDFAEKGPYFALLRFYDPELEECCMSGGKCDRVVELPTAEGLLRFREYIADVFIDCKANLEQLQQDGMMPVKNYYMGYVQDKNDPRLDAIREQNPDFKIFP